MTWKAKPKANGKVGKIPFNPRTGRNAASDNPETWGTFEEAVLAYQNGGYAGVGFVLTKNNPFCGVDLDNCIDDIGIIESWAWKVIHQLNSYTEFSPSGRGLRIFTKARLTAGGRKNEELGAEVYTDSRYLTLTGHHLEETPLTIEDRQEAIELFHKDFIVKGKDEFRTDLKSKTKSERQASAPSAQMDDAEILRKARAAKNGNLFAQLFDQGDWQTAGYPSQSEADQALANILAFWCGRDVDRVENLFRQSALYREKCDRPHYSNGATYLEWTVQKAVNDCKEVYTAGRSTPEQDFVLDWDGSIDTGEDNVPDDSQRKRAIQVNNRFLNTITKEALAALVAKNEPPELFIRNGEIVQVVKILDKDKQGQSFTRPIIKLVNEAALRGYLASSAEYVRGIKKDGEVKYSPAFPPMDLVRNVMVQNNLPLPLLRGIVQVPILRWDGSIVTKHGYDVQSSLYHAPDYGFLMPNIPGNPSQSDVASAIERLKDIVADFPFDSEASRANILAAIMTPVLRDLIAGPVPLLMIDKPSQGTGASLLSDTISIIATGVNSYMTTAPAGREREEEWRKRVTSILSDGRLLVVIDNLEDVFVSPTLCALLTSTNWSDRRLGRNETIELQNRTCWMATGNNIRLAGDLPRRCYKVRMDANMAKPFERDQDEFRHPYLLEYVQENRGELLAAILILAKAWIIAGRPEPRGIPPMGSFGAWRGAIGGILEFAGVSGFLGNAAEIYENAEVNDGIEGFIEALYQEVGDKPITTKQILGLINNPPPFPNIGNCTLSDALPDWLDPRDREFNRKLGRVLAKRAGVIFTNGYKLEKGGLSHKVQLWKISAVS